MSFETLPNDIILLIIKTLKGDSQTLINLSCCSSRLHDLCIGTLYSHIALTTCKDDRSHRLRLFTSHLLSNPSLGKLVRSLNLTSTDWIWNVGIFHSPTTDSPPLPSSLDPSALQTIATNNPLPTLLQQRWCKTLQSDPRNLDALVAVLLTCLRNLTHLETQWCGDLVYTPALFSVLAPKPGSTVLAKLTHLNIATEDQHTTYTFNDFASLLGLPSLTHLFGGGWGQYWAGERHSIPLPHTDSGPGGDDNESGKARDGLFSKVKHLELRRCFLTSHELEELITRCPNLETFILHREGKDCRCFVTLPSEFLGRCLYRVRHSLKNLRVSQEICCGPYDEVASEMLPIDFSAFTVLTELHIAAGHLVRDPERGNGAVDSVVKRAMGMQLWERLPTSLTVLRVMGPSSEGQLRGVLDGAWGVVRESERFKFLKEIRIEGRLKDLERGGEDGDGERYESGFLVEEGMKRGIKVRRMDSTPIGPCRRECCANPDRTDWGMNGEHKWGTQVQGQAVREMSDGSESGSSMGSSSGGSPISSGVFSARF